ncbi:MAG: nicotinate-nicotinamide nucleotide adenylyltransferase [Deltaproteobacteria bacterium]|nr:nicotinate-nicotinamide nucleotide adenylyltransferase [Deltaproteobacteria bacterium]
MAEVALFGGSFDPPHLGHAYVITTVLAREPVEAVWLLPTHSHAFGKRLADFELRRQMCEALASIFGGRVRVDPIEAELAAAAGSEAHASRTVETVAALKERYPELDLAWVIGSDLVDEVPTWREPERLRSLCRFVVVDRAGHGAGEGVPIPDVSSTEVRARLAAGQSVDHLVPARVAKLAGAAAHYRRG